MSVLNKEIDILAKLENDILVGEIITGEKQYQISRNKWSAKISENGNVKYNLKSNSFTGNTEILGMNSTLNQIKTEIYDKCFLEISNFKTELESIEYDACQFEMNEMKIICRSSKITPKKVGQFVTFWKRNEKGITQPYSETDQVDFYVINVKADNNFGQFVFPISELISKGLISTDRKDGKRGFRVYPIWDKAQNKQAVKTQKWQLNYFYEINKTPDLNKVSDLYKRK